MVGKKIVAVVGTYRCGSSVVAEMLHRLGVDMGAPFFGEYFEPSDLASWLRRCWNEPKLFTAEPTSNRVEYLRHWMAFRGERSAIGCKHPLLALSLDDIVQAWGEEAKFVWCKRPIDDSITSLEKMNWWPNGREIQEKLLEKLESFFPRENAIVVDFQDSLQHPELVVERLVDFLGIAPSPEQIASARRVVRQSQNEAMGSKEEGRISIQALGRPNIVGTLLCRNNEQVVGDAVRSVIEYVDKLIMIDTGSTDRSREIVSEIAGPKLQVCIFPWRNDFALARNFALKIATETNARWAMTIDSDERLDFGSISGSRELLNRLESSKIAQAWMVVSRSGNYEKERFIRLPTGLCWKGRTHEALCGANANGRPRLDGVRFREQPKSEEAFRFKLDRDLQILRDDLKDNPDNGRNWYYLGQTLLGLKQFEGAIAAFDRCASIRDWDELAAWACYRAAKCLADCKRFEESIERCVIGMAIDPWYPELAWMNAWCCMQLSQHKRAIAWAKIAISIGAKENESYLNDRIGFRDHIGWYDGPFEILCAAFHKLGDIEARDAAKIGLIAAKEKRVNRLISQSDISEDSLSRSIEDGQANE